MKWYKYYSIFVWFQITEIVNQDYGTIAKILVFLEQIRWDEIVYNDKNLTEKLDKVFDKLLETLCKIDVIVSGNGEAITSHPDRSVVPEKYRVMSSAGRVDRDYVIIRQADDLIGRFIFKYTAIINIVF